MRRVQHVAMALLFLCCSVAIVIAQESDHGRQGDLNDEIIIGENLMTDQEIIDYRQKMQDLETEEDRQNFRQEHRELMRNRARLLGVTVDEKPNPGGMPDSMRAVPDDRIQYPGHFQEKKQ